MSWPTAPLGDLCEVFIGWTPPRKESAYWGPGHPWVSIADLNQGRWIESTKETITEAAIEKKAGRRVPAGTLLLSFKLSIGKVSIASTPLFTNEAIAALPIRQADRLDRDFLYWALRTIRLTGDSNTAVMGATLNLQSLRRIPIPLPPLNEQRRIADVLDRADALRAKRRETLARLDELTQSIFVDMFGNGPDTAGTSAAAPAENDAWEIRPFSDAIQDVTSTVGRIPQTEFAAAGPIPIIDQGANRVAGYTDRQDLASTCALPVVVFGDHTRELKLIDVPFVGGADGVKVLAPGKGVDARYLHALLSHWNIPAAGYSRHFKFLKERTVLVPPLQLQALFGERLRAVEAQKALLRHHCIALDTLFASLQQRAFRGDLFTGDLPDELTDAA